MDRRKDWRAAERLLKQGNVQAALQQLQGLSERDPGDVVTLNRLADLLAKLGKHAEAVEHYTKIARAFEQGGFLPKAIAMHKKILRLDADRLASAIWLGQLYARQGLLGEARKYLLHAANRYMDERRNDKAREVFELLVDAEPHDPRHRVRLAETRAAEGDGAGAASDLLPVANSLLDDGNLDQALPLFRRAHELAPDADESLIGLARCRELAGQSDEALALLEERLGRSEGSPALLGELARRYDAVGRRAEAFKLVEETRWREIPADVWRRMLVAAVERDDADGLWDKLDLLLDADDGDAAGRVLLLEALVDAETDGHLPALVRLSAVQESLGDVRHTIRTLGELARVYEAQGRAAEAQETLARLRELAPADEEPRAQAAPVAAESIVEPTSLVERTSDVAPQASAEPPAEAGRAPASAGPPMGEIPVEVEAPAVPLNRDDEDFVTGRLTQAEVLEKYDLLPQALEQVEEIVQRFPGHVAAQERHREFLDQLGRPSASTSAKLAIAHRAAGEAGAARAAAEKAGESADLPRETRAMLVGLGLLAETGVEDPAPAQPARAGKASDRGARAKALPRGEVLIDLEADDEPADDDLTAIRVALEGDLLDSDDVPAVPESPAEQSVAEVLGEFRKRVEEQIGTDDHRTHYDLGIGYKEMGLIEEAIEEFHLAAETPELHREACTMLALCHRSLQRPIEAVECYRSAMDGLDEASDTFRGLRYDLAEALVEAGNPRAALEHLRDLFRDDPAFRDVRGRLQELEGRLQS